MYVLIDESGDLGFKFARGSSRYFVVAAVVTSDLTSLTKCVISIRTSLRKKYRQGPILHAHTERTRVRERVLKGAAQLNCVAVALAVDKQKIPRTARLQSNTLYNTIVADLVFELVRNVRSLQQSCDVLVSARDTWPGVYKVLAAKLERAIGNAAAGSVRLATPYDVPALQLVDFVAWAVYQKYEFNDDTYADMIQGILQLELRAG
jgi:hypothetical protein